MRSFGKESQPIHVKVGEPFCIELEGTPSAGYVWSLTDRPSAMKVVEEKIHPGSAVGGRARQTFVFEPMEAGEATLTFEYARPWEGKAAEKHQVVVQSQK
jgi:predicted secreted protein